jgi:hypothetical protein
MSENENENKETTNAQIPPRPKIVIPRPDPIIRFSIPVITTLRSK